MNKRTTIKWAIPVLLALVLLLQPVLAQSTGRGEVRGVVRDQNQAVIPGADVTVVNDDTNATSSTITSDVGAYFIGAVQVGAYSMKVEMPGFNTWTTTFRMQAGGTVTIDSELQVGDISTTIEVTDSVSEVSIDRLEVADVKDFDRIQQLPLNGRQVGSLFALTPGVEGTGGTTRVIGQKHGSLEITLDGVSIVDRFGGGLRARVQPRLDTIQEFRIETIGSDARFSRPSTVTLVSRSGTNEFHGSAFWTHRNNGAGLRARRRNEGDTASKLIRNEFGFTAGGPVWLGNLYDGRDKTFWFFTYEGLRTSASRFNSAWPRVPLDAWFEGDFSELIDGSENPITIYNPYTSTAEGIRDPFPNNQIPSDMFHPFAAKLRAITASPNRSVNPALGNNFEYFYPRTDDTNTWTAKVDQVLSEKDNLSVRYTRTLNDTQTDGGVFSNPPPDNLSGGGSSAASYGVNNISANWNRTFSPSVLNELLVGVFRTSSVSGTVADVNQQFAADELGLPNPFNVPGWPTFYGDCPNTSCAWDGDNSKAEPQTHVTFENNLTWVKGDHVLQFGGKAKIEHSNVRELQQAQGSHDFADSWTGLWNPEGDFQESFTGNGLASGMLGLGSAFSNQYNRGFFYFRQNEFGLYVNDKWKVNPRLTVNLGLRWDAWTPYREKQDRLVMIDDQDFFTSFKVISPGDTRIEDIPGIPGGVLSSWAARGLEWQTANETPGMPSGLYKPDWNNFGPRIGLSYMLSDKTVIRGSYGEYFWTMPLAQILQTSRSLPPLNLRFRNIPNERDGSGTYTNRAAPDAADLLQNIVVETEGTIGISSGSQYQMLMTGRTWNDAHGRTWHATLEHEVMRNTALRFSYTGTQGRDLEQRFQNGNDREQEWNYVSRVRENYPSGTARDQLRVNPEWNGRHSVNKTGYSNTHGFQTEVERRFADGIGFQVFYVYTQSKTTTDVGGFTSGNGRVNTTNGGMSTPSFINLYQQPNPVGPVVTSDPGYESLQELIYLNTANIPPHRIGFNGIVDLPFGRGKKIGSDVSGAVNQVIGGWQVAFIGSWRTGFRQNVNTGRGVFGQYLLDPSERKEIQIFGNNQVTWFAGDFDPTSCTGNCDGLTDLVPEDRSQRAIHPYGASFNNRVPIELNDGTMRDTTVMGAELYWPFERNTFRGPQNWNVDLSIFKHFYITEDVNLRFTADFFNFFNAPNDPNPNNGSGLVNLGISANEPRTVQLSLRLDW